MDEAISLSECINYIHDEVFRAQKHRERSGHPPILKVAKATVELHVVLTRATNGGLSLGVKALGFGADGGRKIEDSSIQRITLELQAVNSEDIIASKRKLVGNEFGDAVLQNSKSTVVPTAYGPVVLGLQPYSPVVLGPKDLSPEMRSVLIRRQHRTNSNKRARGSATMRTQAIPRGGARTKPTP